MSAPRPKILAIDDIPENLVVLGTALAEDFDFQLASSGPQGLALAEASPPDLILLDVMMPQVSGFETCKRFKAHPGLKDIPIIFLTAVNELEAEVSGFELGAVDYISKPIRVELVRQRIRNILRLTQLDQHLKASEERLRLVMEATGEGIWDWRIASGEVFHNASWCRILGLDESFLTHSVEAFTERIHPEDMPTVRKKIQDCLAGGETYISEHRLRHAQGHYLWVADRGQIVARGEDGAPLRMVGSMKDIEERKQHEAEIHRLAFYDPLTALPNRRLLMDRLQHTLSKNQRRKEFGALMFLDMDRFKQLNDSHGHDKGDLLLIQVANRLRSCVRETDTVSRIGGDEFVIMLEHVAETSGLAIANGLVVGKKILAALNQPYQLGDIHYSSTPSIGLTQIPGRDDTVDEVLKRADLAMYEAKAAGRNTIRVFEHSPKPT